MASAEHLDESLGRAVSATTIPSLVVGVSINGRRSIASGGGVPPTADASFRIASLTKPFTSAATVRALHQRGLPLGTPAIELLPTLAEDWAADKRITVAHLLGQIAGLRPTVDAAMVAALGDGDDAIMEGARLVVRAGNEHPPGARWAYYNGNYFLLGALLSSVTGRTFEEELSNSVLRPWGLSRTGFALIGSAMGGWDGGTSVPASIYPRSRRPSGGLWSCMSDLLTFAEHLLADEEVLEETRRVRTRPSDRTPYGLGWALGPSGQMYLNGRLPGYRAAAVVLPDAGYASFALANREDALPELAATLNRLQHPLSGDDLSLPIDAFAA